MSYVYLNNQLLPAAEARVSVFDRGFAYGDAVFETIKMIAGRPVFFLEHLERLTCGMAAAGFRYRPDPEALRHQALELAVRNGVELGRLRILATRGTPPEPEGPDPGVEHTATMLVTVEPFAGVPEELYINGVPARIVHAHRGFYAHVKSASLLASIMSRREVHHAGAWEGIMTSGHGRMLEGIYTNIFFLAGGLLLTAPETDHILPGVTRQKVIEIAPALDLKVEQLTLTLEELLMAGGAAFFTSSLLGICRISEIDEKQLPTDPGAIAMLRHHLGILENESSLARG